MDYNRNYPYKYKDGSLVKVGDVITDGGDGREDVRLKNKVKVLYIDKYSCVVFPLNDFSCHFPMWSDINYKPTIEDYKSRTWTFSHPKRVAIGELTEDELFIYNNTNKLLLESE